MSTPIRPELSKKNRYYISRDRYYELAHFCRQYDELNKKYDELETAVIRTSESSAVIGRNFEESSQTENIALTAASIKERIELIDRALLEVDGYIRESMKLCVTLGVPFDKLNANQPVPICRDYFYINYRKFFWILDKLRG